MKIRRLFLTDLEDFAGELKYAGVSVSGQSLQDYLPTHYIFKLSDIPEDRYLPLLHRFTELTLPYWTNKNNPPHSLLVAFPDWSILDCLPEDEITSELLSLKDRYSIDQWELKLSSGKMLLDCPMIMGILNVTPDSFSDGGQFLDPHQAIAQAERMVADGADIIDIGAESTRPGAQRVEQEAEWKRLEPILKQLKDRIKVPISIDTYKAEIARRALDMGAEIINDISGLRFDPEMTTVVADSGCPVILMHMKGTPREMQKNPHYENLMEELYAFFEDRLQFCRKRNIQQVIIDPGIGFGKRLQDNYEIIRRLPEFKAFGCPVLVGPSRKSFIGKVLKNDAPDRLIGTAATVAVSLMNGANILRVHDVNEIREIMQITRAIQSKNFLHWID